LGVRQLRHGLLALLGLGLLVQLVPYGRDHRNPQRGQEPGWDRSQSRELFFRVCKDCHSNQTEWPWYSFVAPVSWLVQRDVDEGRSHFNVSEWGRSENHGDEAAEKVREGEMPPWFYLPLHPEAQLSDAEREALIAGLVATFGEEQSDDEEESDGEEESHHSHAHDH
jgi:mono/diheme cytochrome c family protein